MVANDQNSDEEVDAAWLWMEYLSQPDIMAEWTYGSPDGTNLPPLTSLLEGDDLIEEKPVLEGFAKLMDCGVASRRSNPKAPQVEEVLNEELAEAIYGLQTADGGARQGRRTGRRRSSTSSAPHEHGRRRRPGPGGPGRRPRREGLVDDDRGGDPAATEATTGRPVGSAARRAGLRREWSAYLFLAPGLIIFSVFTVFSLLVRVLADVPRVEHHPAGDAVRRPGQLPGDAPRREVPAARSSTRSTSPAARCRCRWPRAGYRDAGQPADPVPWPVAHVLLPAGRHPVRGAGASCGSGSTTASSGCSTSTC